MKTCILYHNCEGRGKFAVVRIASDKSSMANVPVSCAVFGLLEAFRLQIGRFEFISNE
jgi:hypothetical protein